MTLTSVRPTSSERLAIDATSGGPARLRRGRIRSGAVDHRTGGRSARPGGPALELVGIAVRATTATAQASIPLFTTDAEALVTREDVDLVIEVIGGIEPARSLILGALRHGASVVTANKTLLAADGATLFEAAEQAGADLYFEAAVAGAIPIIRPLRVSCR